MAGNARYDVSMRMRAVELFEKGYGERATQFESKEPDRSFQYHGPRRA